MKVAIEARLPDPSGSGGVSQAVISLASALSNLKDCRPGEEFIFITLESAGNWLDAYVSGPCRLHKIPLTWKNRLARSPLGPAAKAVQSAGHRLRPPSPPGIVSSDGIAERLGAQLIHFPSQDAYLTDLPNIYQPHDLQHVHLPQFFPAEELAWRRLAYPLYCAKAATVLVESTWTKQDVMQQYAIPADRVAVCPFPPATSGYREPSAGDISSLKQKLRYAQFLFYPAHTWPHKNHLRLIEALALLKERSGLVIPLVCTGRKTPFFTEIQAVIQRLDLAAQISFLGYLSEAEIKLLYRTCTAVIVPTKFESVSFPVWEAFEAHKPVACSTATSLPMQVGAAGLLFDPDQPSQIADAIMSLWSDPDLRGRLGEAGAARLRQFSLDRTAVHIRALYRRLAGGADAQDLAILQAPPLI
jgi:glycosyltransferase involved in cell wall biosynthesis